MGLKRASPRTKANISHFKSCQPVFHGVTLDCSVDDDGHTVAIYRDRLAKAEFLEERGDGVYRGVVSAQLTVNRATLSTDQRSIYMGLLTRADRAGNSKQ